jgi:hypothetical protein
MADEFARNAPTGTGPAKGAQEVPVEKKKARDGTLRGRPPLFGKAGDYERVYAEVRPATARRLKRDAERRGVSASHALCGIAEHGKPSEIDAAAVAFSKGDEVERVYGQLQTEAAARLKRESAARGWSVSRLLGVMVEAHYAAVRDLDKVGT